MSTCKPGTAWARVGTDVHGIRCCLRDVPMHTWLNLYPGCQHDAFLNHAPNLDRASKSYLFYFKLPIDPSLPMAPKKCVDSQHPMPPGPVDPGVPKDLGIPGILTIHCWPLILSSLKIQSFIVAHRSYAS